MKYYFYMANFQLLNSRLLYVLNFSSNCLTGQPECVPEEPTCWITGQCLGNKLSLNVSASPEDCLIECNNQVSISSMFFARILRTKVLSKSNSKQRKTFVQKMR